MISEDDVKVGLAHILYELYYVTPDAVPEFDKKAADYFNKYSKEDLRLIGSSIEYVLQHDEYPLNNILPNQERLSNDQIRAFLKYIYSGFKQYGLFTSDSELVKGDKVRRD